MVGQAITNRYHSNASDRPRYWGWPVAGDRATGPAKVIRAACPCGADDAPVFDLRFPFVNSSLIDNLQWQPL